MPPVPKKKHTHSRSHIRRHSPSKKGVLPALVVCSACKKLKRPHMACPFCGFYK